MTSQGPNSPTAGANETGIGATAWGNPGNIVASDDARAAATNTPALNLTNYLVADFSFSVPAGATIDGIIVEVEKHASSTGVRDELVQLRLGGTLQGDNKADTVTDWVASGSEAYVSYGGAADKWGLTPSVSDINSMEVVLVAENTSGSNRTPRVDHIRVTVHYTEGGTPYTQDVAGTLTSAGTAVKQAGKPVAGALTSSGVLAGLRTAYSTLAGTMTSGGTVVKQAGKWLAGVLSSSGILTDDSEEETVVVLTADTDTYLNSSVPDTNFGTANTFQERQADFRSLIQFDLSAIPAGSTIVSAVYSLWNSFVSATDVTINLHRIKAANGGWTESGATWNTIEGSTAWAGSAGCSTSGTDYEATPIGSIVFVGGTPNGSEIQTSLDAAQVEALLSANYGWVGIRPVSGNPSTIWRSSDFSTVEQRPQLTITYIEPAGAYFQSLAGVLTSAGVVARQTGKGLAGAVASGGALGKRPGKGLAGVLNAAGDVVKRAAVSRAGTLASGGELVRQVDKQTAGTLPSSGTVQRVVGKGLVGTLATAGTVIRLTAVKVIGTLPGSGTLATVLVVVATALVSLTAKVRSFSLTAKVRTFALRLKDRD